MAEEKDAKFALEQYRNILGYLQYENTIYWTRSGFMLIAHSTLFGFLTRLLPQSNAEKAWQGIGLSFGVCMLGLALSFLWTRAIMEGLRWIDRWHSILLTLEPDAYGEIAVFRGAVTSGDHSAPRRGVSKVALDVALLFRYVWLAALAYIATIGINKFVG
jgi:hypothetical protein